MSDLAVKHSSLAGTRLDLLLKAIDLTHGFEGEVWECGTWQGGTALWMKEQLKDGRILRLFDTFCGLPVSGPLDLHRMGTMGDTSYELVRSHFEDMPDVVIHVGVMPATFAGLEDVVISVAHIDVDQYQSVKDCLEFVYPRVERGGWVFIDDYADGKCPGARRATDDFMADKPERLNASIDAQPQAHFIKL